MAVSESGSSARRSNSRKRSPDFHERLAFLKSRAPLIISVGVAIVVITALFFAVLFEIAG